MTETWTCVGLFGTCSMSPQHRWCSTKWVAYANKMATPSTQLMAAQERHVFRSLYRSSWAISGIAETVVGSFIHNLKFICPYWCTSCPPCSNRQSAMSVHKSTDKVDKCTRGCGMDISSHWHFHLGPKQLKKSIKYISGIGWSKGRHQLFCTL